MKKFDLERYIRSYDIENDEFLLVNVPENKVVDLINEFTFFIEYRNKEYKVNVHSNKGKHLVLKDFNANVNPAKIRHY